jgi:hypothetical protein
MIDALQIVQKYFPSVTEVHDADDDLLLEVNAQDSTEGKLKDHSHCAFARACQKKFKARGVIVSINTVYVIQKEGATRYKLPESVSREIISFDRKGGFAEGEYMLKAPPKSNRLGARHERPDNRTGSHAGKRKGKTRFMHLTTGIRAMLKGGERLA